MLKAGEIVDRVPCPDGQRPSKTAEALRQRYPYGTYELQFVSAHSPTADPDPLLKGWDIPGED